MNICPAREPAGKLIPVNAGEGGKYCVQTFLILAVVDMAKMMTMVINNHDGTWKNNAVWGNGESAPVGLVGRLVGGLVGNIISLMLLHASHPHAQDYCQIQHSEYRSS